MNEERRIQSDGSAVFLGVGAILVLRPISADSASTSILLPRVMNCRLKWMPQTAVFYSGKVKPSTGNDGSGEPVNRTSSRVVDECRISAKSAETPVVIAF